MIYLNIPLFIVAAFLLLTLGVGIYFSRKSTSFREYAVGNKQFATATLVATVLATAYSGGGLLRNVEQVHNLGLYWIIIIFGWLFSFWKITFLALRMGPFMQHLSMAETIGSIYGKYPRIITALFSICDAAALIATQISAMSLAITMCIHTVDPRIAAIISTSILVFYSTFGGIRAVTYTDVLQLITFTIIIPFLAYFMFLKTGKSVAEIIPFLQSQEKFRFSNVFRFDTKLLGMIFLLLSILMGGYVEPPTIQRVYMSSSSIQGRRVFLYSTLFSLVITSIIILIGIFVFVGAPGLQVTEVWDYIMTHIPPVFKALVSVSLLAMAMSTADSKLNACSVTASYDILGSIHKGREITDGHQLKIARCTTLIVGLFSMFLTFHYNDLLELLKLSMVFSLPIIPAPFILAVFGFRGTSRTALIGMAAGVLTILAWNKWVKPATGIDGSFTAMLANGLAMMLAHYLLKQPKGTGWVDPDDTFKQIQQEKARKRATRKESVKNSWANRTFTLAQLRPSHTTMVYVGLYLIFTSLMTYFVAPTTTNSCWLTLHLSVAAYFLGHPFLYDISKRIRAIPKWCISLGWLAWLALYPPISLLWHWWHLADPIFTTSLFLTHCMVILWALPLHLAITNSCWLTLHLSVAAYFLGHPFLYDISKRIRAIPKWCISLGWLAWLALYPPISLLWHWWHLADPIFTTSLFLTHCMVILWALPLHLAIGVVATTVLVSIYPIAIGLSFSVCSSLFPLFIASLLVFTVIICFKVKQDHLTTQNIYLRNQQKIREAHKLKASLYEAALVPSNRSTFPKPRGYGFMLNQVVRKVEESTSFLDNHTPLYKEDLQSIFNKLYDWVAYFNRREMAKYPALIQPNKITLDQLMRKVEAALSQEVADPPRLLLENIKDPNGTLCPYMVCDIDQVVYLLVQAVLRVGKLDHATPPLVRIQLHPTALQFTQAEPIDEHEAPLMEFPAAALVISQATADLLPKVQAFYADVINVTSPQSREKPPPSIDLQQQTISTIIGAHYGYLEFFGTEKQRSMLLILPNDVTKILGKMTTRLPIDCLTSETPVTPKEQADSMMALMQFHDYVSKSSHEEDPIDIKTISGLLLLLRQHFGFRRHESGQLFYVRAVGIASLVVEWVFHSPKVIYAALLYGLVRRTCLPLSYIKKHYNLGVYAFVSNVVNIDKHQELAHPSLLCLQNRLKEAIREEHVQLSVLFIKLAERLYDLRHAAGYIHFTEVQHMAKETLAIDVQLAHTYLGPEIGAALEHAAKEALKMCKDKDQESHKKKDS